MANVVLPSFPALASGALFVKGVANNGTVASAAQYVTFGHSFQVGQLPATSGLNANFGAGAVPAQVDPKTHYQDGSVAHAIVTVEAPAVAASVTAWGQFSPATPTGSALDLSTALGSTTLALTVTATTPAETFTEDLIALVKGATPNLWLTGPLAVQGRAYAVLYESLRVQVDMTAYADGTVNADVMVANDIATLITSGQSVEGGTVDYTAKLTLNGSVAYTSPALTHYLYENWTWQIGTAPVTNSSQASALQIIHDPNDFIAAQAVQSYNTTLGVDQGNLATAQGYVAASGFGAPLANPAYGGTTLVAEGMGGTGGRPDIGINDAFCAWWLVTQNAGFHATAMECAKVGGGIPWHYWNATTGQFLTTDDDPSIWTFAPTYSGAYPYTPQYGGLTLLAQTSADPDWALDNAHFPDLVYLNYLSTGRRYFLDELNAVTAWVETSATSGWAARNYGQGIIMRTTQVRATAWGMRNLLNATYANPDGTAPKLYFRQMLDNNLYWFLAQIETYQAIQGNQCFGWFPNWGYGALRSNWEESYLFSSLSMAAIMGHWAALQICQWMANYFVGLFSSGGAGFPAADAVAYENGIYQTFGESPGTGTDYGWGGPTLPAQTWGAIENLTQQFGYSNISGGAVVWNAASGGDYGQLLWIALANYITLGQAGAGAALNTLQTMTAADGTNAPYIDDGSWAIGPLSMVVPRTLNDSQILHWTGAPTANVINAALVVGTVSAAATIAGAAQATDMMSGAVVVGRVAAMGRLGMGSVSMVGAADLGRIVAAGKLAMPTYAELAASISTAVSELESVLSTIEQWEATSAAEAKSAPARLLKTLEQWEAAFAAEVKSIEATLAQVA